MAPALLRSQPDSSSSLEPTKSESSLITCLEDTNISSYRGKKNLTRPSVYTNLQMAADVRLPLLDEPSRSEGYKNKDENYVGDEVKDKIQKALNLLTFRDPYNLIQLWSPCNVGKYKILQTLDQPFVLGIRDERLCNYRQESERKGFHVDEECKLEDLVPIVRVFKQLLPEWTYDVTNYHSKNHPLRDCAIRWNLHGYLVIPVFDSFTMLCVGVLEFITSSKYLDCAYEVQEIHKTLKAANLTSPQAFDCPTSYAEFESTQDEIFKILKDCCFTHKLPLAQAWKASPMSSFVATKRNIEMACSSFNFNCTGKVCVSTTGLPFYVWDLRFWPFREACREHHLLKSKGVVGRALSSHGSCFCADVTKLGEDEYSLVHNARMSGLTSCLAIYLHSREHDDSYVLEFFLPVDMKESADLQNLVQKLKLHVKSSSFEFGDLLGTEVIGMPMDLTDIIQLDSKDLQTVAETNAQNYCKNALDQHDFSNRLPKNSSGAIANTEGVCVDDATSKNIDLVSGEKGFSSGEKGALRKQKRQHKTDDLVSALTPKYFGSLSREIVQLNSETVEKTNAQTDCTSAQDQHDVVTKDMSVDDDIGKSIDVVTGEKEVCTKQRRKRKMEFITPEYIKQYFGKPMEEASRKLGVSRSTLKRACRKFNIASWPMPKRNKKTIHFGIYVAVFLLIKVKRWSCSSNHHDFSARWWVCGKHNSFVSRSNPSPEGEMITMLLSSSQQLKEVKEPDESTKTVTPFSKPPRPRFGIYDAACLLIGVRRWRKMVVIQHTTMRNDYKLADGQMVRYSATCDVFHASSPKNNVAKVSDDCRMVTVKATYKDDMIKFRIPISSGLKELKNHVAQRIKLENTKLHLKYRDEDDDLILIACDADFHNLVSYSATSVSNQTIKLIVHIAKN